MRVAALYDIHGNLPALEAVLAEVRAVAVDRIVVGGDVVPGPMPGESIAALLDLDEPASFIRGNGEVAVVALSQGEEPDGVPARFIESIGWVGDALSAEQLATLGSWPLTERLELPGLGRLLFCHATPRDENEIFTRVTPEERVAQRFLDADAELVVCGHTHMQFDRVIAGVRVVNAGSVGMPFGSPGAYWALLAPDRVELRRTDYDVRRASERIAATGYPDAQDLRLERPATEREMLELFEAAASRVDP